MDGAHIVTAAWNSDYTRVIIFFAVVAAVVTAALLLIAKRGTFKGLSVRTQRVKSDTKDARPKASNSLRSRFNEFFHKKKNDKT
jgi:hypothetical protein